MAVKHDVESIDRALTFHAKTAPMDYMGFIEGRFEVRFREAPDNDWSAGIKLTPREAHLVAYGLATGRRSNDLERKEA